MNSLAIANVTIRRDHSGRFCLNDLHRASGGAGRHRPGVWLANEQTRELIAVLGSRVDSRQGTGTFADKPLVIAYAAWIDTEIHAAVVRGLAESASSLAAILSALEAFEVPTECAGMFVYAIRNETTGNVKIGISRDPSRRLRQLQIGNDCQLTLIASREAVDGFSDERDLHRENAAVRIRGEWFDNSLGKISLTGVCHE